MDTREGGRKRWIEGGREKADTYNDEDEEIQSGGLEGLTRKGRA